MINRNGTRILTLDFNGVFKRSWDVVGTQTSIAALDDDVYVTGLPDSSGKRQVQVYSSEGVLIRSWTRKGRRNRGYSQSPSRLAISNKGEVYVADSWGRNVQVFDRNGSFVRKWNHRGEDQPSEVESIAISESNDGEDEVYLAHDDRIEIFSGCGIYQRTLQVEKWNDDDEEEEFTTTTSAMATIMMDTILESSTQLEVAAVLLLSTTRAMRMSLTTQGSKFSLQISAILFDIGSGCNDSAMLCDALDL